MNCENYSELKSNSITVCYAFIMASLYVIFSIYQIGTVYELVAYSLLGIFSAAFCIYSRFVLKWDKSYYSLK